MGVDRGVALRPPSLFAAVFHVEHLDLGGIGMVDHHRLALGRGIEIGKSLLDLCTFFQNKARDTLSQTAFDTDTAPRDSGLPRVPISTQRKRPHTNLLDRA